jgi:hypothetical protein
MPKSSSTSMMRLPFLREAETASTGSYSLFAKVLRGKMSDSPKSKRPVWRELYLIELRNSEVRRSDSERTPKS